MTKRLRVLLLCLLLVLAGTPAQAATTTFDDEVGESGNGVDVVSVTVANRPQTLILRVAVERLRPRELGAYAEWFPESSRYTYAVSTGHHRGERYVHLDRYDYTDIEVGEQVPQVRIRCEGLEARALRVNGTLAMVVPQRCLGRDAGAITGGFVNVADADSSDGAGIRRAVPRGPRRQPQPLGRAPGGGVCNTGFGAGPVTLGHLWLRNESDGVIVIDEIRVRGAVGLRTGRMDVLQVPHIRGVAYFYGATKGYPPRWRHAAQRRAWRARQPVPGARIPPGVPFDVITRARKTADGPASLDTRIVEYHDADGRHYTWRPDWEVKLRAGDRCF